MSELIENKDKTVSLGEWIITFIIICIPIVGVIMLLVWAFGTDAKTSKKSWAQAALIMAVVYAVIGLIFTAAFVSAFSGYFSETFGDVNFSDFLKYMTNS